MIKQIIDAYYDKNYVPAKPVIAVQTESPEAVLSDTASLVDNRTNLG